MVSRPSAVLRDLALPITLLLTISSGGYWLGAELDRQAEVVFDLGVRHAGTDTAGRIDTYAKRQQALIDLLASEILPKTFAPTASGEVPETAANGFTSASMALINSQPGFQAINWVLPDGTIDMVSPQNTNTQASSKPLLEHEVPGVRAAFQGALDATGRHDAVLQLTPLIELYQGGRGFALYMPTFSEQGQLLGVTNAAFRVADLIAEAAPTSDPDGHTMYEVRGPDGERLFAVEGFDEATAADQASSHPIGVLNLPWTLEVRPTDAWLAQGLVQRGVVVQILGMVFGLVLAASSWGLARRRRRQMESDLRLQLALDGASLGVWDLDVPSGRLHLNDQWLAMLGYSAEDVRLDLAFYRTLVHPEDLDVVERTMRDHLAGHTEDYRTEHRLRSASGDWVWVLDQGRIVERDPSGRPLRLAGTQTDFTEVRTAELELERSVARYRAIFEHSPVGLLEQDMSPAKRRFDELRAAGVTDLGAYFEQHPDAITEFEGLPITLDINPAFLRLFAATTVAEYRENVLHMVDERARRSYAVELAALFDGASSCEVDFPLRNLEGEELLYTVRLTVAPGCLDDLSSVLVSLVDNTRILREEEQRRVQEAREREVQKEESLALLAGGVAHDFNNLLVPIIGNIELAKGGLPGKSLAGDNLLRAEQAAQRAAELARQMLTYSGRGQVKSQSFDLNALVAEMSALLSSSLPGKVELLTDFHDGQLGIEGDPTQLRQLVMNLVINAADAVGSEAGRVVVRTGHGRPTERQLSDGFLGAGLADKECAFLEVRDSGRGIDEETRKRIFEPFFSTKSAGRGLGMSVVLGIVRGHGGGLVVQSEPGQGTRIRAWFVERELADDAVCLTPKPGTTTVPPLPTGLKARVLLADDEAPVRRFATRALESVGVEVVAARDGLEALKAFEEQGSSLDLAILDATMPRMGGIETMEGIREQAAGFPVVLSSGYTLEGVATHAAESEACWFLPKPFGVTELVRMVTAVLAEKDAGEEERIEAGSGG